MKVKCILQPGQAGTKRLVQQYGDNLVCVRYRYDKKRKMVYKTIEIIIDKKPWAGEAEKIADEHIVGIRVAIDEIEVRRRVKSAGGKWDAARQVWELSYKKVKELGLVERVAKDDAKNL